MIELLTELVIFAREHGGDDMPEISRVIRSAEQRIAHLRNEKQRRLTRRQMNLCLRCECRRTEGLLCAHCWLEAPPAVRAAFKMASGIDGMREADRLVRAWARRQLSEEAAA